MMCLSLFHKVAACRSRWLAAAAMVFASATPVAGQEFLSDGLRTNGSSTMAALGDLREKAVASSVQIGKERNNAIPAMVVTPDGYLLTAASEATNRKPLRAFLRDGSEMAVREVKLDVPLNLMLLKLDKAGLKEVTWGESRALKAGQWLFSLSDRNSEGRLGVMSAKRRAIPNSGAVLGVRFGLDDGDAGVVIEEIATESPAAVAGLIADDVVLAVNGEKVFRNENLARIIAAHQPGDVIKIRYAREGQEEDCEVRLASKRHVLMNWLGEDFANHGTSLRTDNFPEIIQHDQPLFPSDMGGAIYDLQGRAVGLNIARVDRVTNYALPVEIFLAQAMGWIEADRKAAPKPATVKAPQ